MFDAAALVLEEIAPKDKTRNGVLGARVDIYMAAKKWDMAAAVASHLVKVDPETAGWYISLAYAVRRSETIEKAEAILFEVFLSGISLYRSFWRTLAGASKIRRALASRAPEKESSAAAS
jgi:predicted Zn-dependent protease